MQLHALNGEECRKLMTMHGTLHPKSDADRVDLSREMGGKGLISCEGCIRMEENNLGWYFLFF